MQLWNVVPTIQDVAAAYAVPQFHRAFDHPREVGLWVGGLVATTIFVAFEALHQPHAMEVWLEDFRRTWPED